MEIWLIEGPNLNLVGVREPEHYGSSTLDAVWDNWRTNWSSRGVEVHRFQSNHEGDLIDALHRVGFTSDAIVLNPGGYTHTSVALRDAVAAIRTPVIEVHLTHIHSREDFRSVSLVSAVCRGGISGFGLDGYRLAIEGCIALMAKG